jgi:hypothetical protein
MPQARFIADERTNSLLVTASSPQHTDIARLLETADASLDTGDRELAIITLQQASPSTVQRIVEEVVVGRDPAKKDRVHISAQDGSNLFVVRASKEDIAVKQVSRRSIRPRPTDTGEVHQARRRTRRWWRWRCRSFSGPGAGLQPAGGAGDQPRAVVGDNAGDADRVGLTMTRAGAEPGEDLDATPMQDFSSGRAAEERAGDYIASTIRTRWTRCGGRRCSSYNRPDDRGWTTSCT